MISTFFFITSLKIRCPIAVKTWSHGQVQKPADWKKKASRELRPCEAPHTRDELWFGDSGLRGLEIPEHFICSRMKIGEGRVRKATSLPGQEIGRACRRGVASQSQLNMKQHLSFAQVCSQGFPWRAISERLQRVTFRFGILTPSHVGLPGPQKKFNFGVESKTPTLEPGLSASTNNSLHEPSKMGYTVHPTCGGSRPYIFFSLRPQVGGLQLRMLTCTRVWKKTIPCGGALMPQILVLGCSVQTSVAFCSSNF